MPFLRVRYSLETWKIEPWHKAGSGLKHLFSVLTSHRAMGTFLQFLRFLGKWAPVDLWNFFTGKVNERGPFEYIPPPPTTAECVSTCACACLWVMQLFEDPLSPFFGRPEAMGCYFPSHLGTPSWLKPMDYLIPPIPVWLFLLSKDS